MESLFVSNLVILPEPGEGICAETGKSCNAPGDCAPIQDECDPFGVCRGSGTLCPGLTDAECPFLEGTCLQDPTQEAVDLHAQAMQQAIQALTDHIHVLPDPDGLGGTDNTRAAAWEARNFLQLFQEAAQVIGQHTSQCAPNASLRDPNCAILIADDEGGVDIDNVFPGFSRQVRSPFFIGNSTSGMIQEQVIVPQAIGLDECVIVLKEIQGVKAVVRRVLIPIWVEPWAARARIVGFKVTWVWEFIPAEFLKTISYCNIGGAVVQNVQTRVVLERELLHFWGFLDKDVQLTP